LDKFFYTNDISVLLDVTIRELWNLTDEHTHVNFYIYKINNNIIIIIYLIYKYNINIILIIFYIIFFYFFFFLKKITIINK